MEQHWTPWRVIDGLMLLLLFLTPLYFGLGFVPSFLCLIGVGIGFRVGRTSCPRVNSPSSAPETDVLDA